MSKPAFHLFMQRYSLFRHQQHTSALRRARIPEAAESFIRFMRVGDQLKINIGLRLPKPVAFILKLVGLSPGSITLWYDAECGWLTEARATPDAPPVYHYVEDNTAISLFKGELTHELEEVLMTPDTYLGE